MSLSINSFLVYRSPIAAARVEADWKALNFLEAVHISIYIPSYSRFTDPVAL